MEEPGLLGQSHLPGILLSARGTSFLVSAPPGCGAGGAAALIARLWLGAGPGDEPADLQVYAKPTMAEVRTIIADSQVRPLEGPRKAIIVETLRRPPREVLNALLGLTEEPPVHLGLFLVTEDERTLPVTLRSRLIPLKLRPVTTDVLVNWLGSHTGKTQAQVHQAAVRSRGWPGRAVLLLEDDGPSGLESIKKALLTGGFLLAAEEVPSTDRKSWLTRLEREVTGIFGEMGDPAYLKAAGAVRRAQGALDRNGSGALVLENLVLDLAALGILGPRERSPSATGRP